MHQFMKNITKYVPLDKSWTIRCLVLDILNGYEDGYEILSGQNWSSDILHAMFAAKTWKTEEDIYVGESATLFRFLKFVAWKTNVKKNFILARTLLNRTVTDDPSIVNMSIKKLLTLDGGTSQWASAAYLCGERRDIPELPPFKLSETIRVQKIWKECREKKQPWPLVPDATIFGQMNASIQLAYIDGASWKPLQSEDYCFARAFDLVTPEEGKARWPSLENHETNRILEMERAILKFNSMGIIDSNDHRVVQSLVLRATHDKKDWLCTNTDCVSKSWPQFFDFVKELKSI